MRIHLISRFGKRLEPMSPPPDFRNLGVLLRILLGVEGLALLAAYVYADSAQVAWELFSNRGALGEMALLSTLSVLMLVQPWLGRLTALAGHVVVLAVALLSTLMWSWMLQYWFPDIPQYPAHSSFLALLAVTALSLYFDWRQRRLSPALVEARLMALQARIRPHFLYNSLNTVLGLIREDARRAEQVLEDLAELFRALMAEPRVLVPLAQELGLARSYAEIEGVRLGNRLHVVWHCETAPMDALVPPLLIQPLLENAVYHGVEPLEQGGRVNVNVSRDGDWVELVMCNSCGPNSARRDGNRMALENLRERLELHFDAEASIVWRRDQNEFEVRVRWPYRRLPEHGRG